MATFPSVEWIERCEKVDPGYVDRVLRMAEREQKFRHIQTYVGQVFGLVVAFAFLGASTFLIATGHEISGAVLGTIDLVALVAVFVVNQVGKSPLQEESSDKGADEVGPAGSTKAQAATEG